MKAFRYALMVACIVTPCCAEEAARPISASDQVALTIGQLVIANANLTAQVEQLRGIIKSAQERVRDLEQKYEPKPEGK